MSTRDQALAQAQAALDAASPRAEADPARPRYHFRPPAHWMNDPNGTIYADGVYHVFYQLNPYADHWGDIHWGHTTSRDLVHWTHQPVALWPSGEAGEAHCFSGCAAVDGDGRPMLLYTSVAAGPREQRPPFQQWAARGDATWTTWEKHPANPILNLETHGGPAFKGTWRDPFLFEAGGRTLMALGAELEETATVALYEAADRSLTRWTYRGLLYEEPAATMQFCECPNFVNVDGTWLLLLSPYRPVEYIAGDFDAATLTFTPKHRGQLDPGVSAAAQAGHYYATNIIHAPDGRTILLGWVRGWEAGRGWNGCLALPRVLTVDADGLPRQAPVAELAALRGREQRGDDVHLPAAAATVMATGVSSCCEVQAMVTSTAAWTLQLRPADASAPTLTVTVEPNGVRVGAEQVPVALDLRAGVDVHLFVDRSTVEVFVADGRVAVTLVHEMPAALLEVDLLSTAAATVQWLGVWELNAIWP